MNTNTRTRNAPYTSAWCSSSQTSVDTSMECSIVLNQINTEYSEIIYALSFPVVVESQSVLRFNVVKTDAKRDVRDDVFETNVMTSIIFKSTFFTSPLQPWKHTISSWLCNYSQTSFDLFMPIGYICFTIEREREREREREEERETGREREKKTKIERARSACKSLRSSGHVLLGLKRTICIDVTLNTNQNKIKRTQLTTFKRQVKCFDSWRQDWLAIILPSFRGQTLESQRHE